MVRGRVLDAIKNDCQVAAPTASSVADAGDALPLPSAVGCLVTVTK